MRGSADNRDGEGRPLAHVTWRKGLMAEVEVFLLLGLVATAVFSAITFGMARRGQRAIGRVEDARDRVVEGLKALVRDGIVPDRDEAAMLIVAASTKHRLAEFEIGTPEAMLCRLFEDINSDPLVGPHLKRAVVPQLAEHMHGRRPGIWSPDRTFDAPALARETVLVDEVP
jgi:hypothetical protein